MEAMNKEQKMYLAAKADLAVAEEYEKKLEAEFLKKKGYKESSIYLIQDVIEFDKLNEEFADLPEAKIAWFSICQARDKMLEVEEKLIDYALSLIPMRKEREVLTAAKNNWKVRQELIDIVMRLDAPSVKLNKA